MIKQFTVKNFKALESVSLPLTPIHVLIGQNDSGKTSLLEAIHAFCSSTRVPLNEAFPGMSTGQDLVHFGSTTSLIDLSATLFDSGAPLLRYEFGVDFSSRDGRTCRRAYERFAFDTEGIKDIPPLTSGWTSVGFRQDGSLDARKELDRIAEIIGASSLYRLDARMMAMPAAIDPSRRFRMDYDGFGLPTLLDDLRARP